MFRLGVFKTLTFLGQKFSQKAEGGQTGPLVRF
ncbi:hypothetical protein; truncated putative e1F-2alpha-like protein [Ranavirus ambystoma1]|uniref:Uncharacterized protein n=2 Tax=Ranavirus ambystoma1 TaxID=265294 RepID=Q6YH68_9VIRU|nr:hypothetical protein ATVp58 [Ambystoma tigrinum virus]AAP33235.1 unknown [Ambystoma tigrinum stebbensi virus]ALN36453.1 truncated putative e1F-2alpha-like protein [Ambystoma tigrinum virus]ALN36549.1 hypothetical protein 54R [Ambystoma tigrinum virus]ALN36654.1 truncated putative e1F-2alpha-like protein [Ambystoma tigrinum virus]ALN36757.1 truncated putative e1F-2alpha-like protein [Ambystoma tigrinum virus]